VVSAPERVTSEQGGTARFEVSLVDAPAAEVVMDVSSADSTEGALLDPVTSAPVVGVTLRFGPADWSVPQAVTAVGVDDDAVDGDVAWTVTLSASSADERYAGLLASLSFTTLDDEVAGIFWPTETFLLPEPSVIQVCAAIVGVPGQEVWVPIRTGDPTEVLVSVSPGGRSFAEEQTLALPPGTSLACFHLVGVHDGIEDGTVRVLVTVGPTSSADPAFDALPPQSLTVDVENVPLPPPCDPFDCASACADPVFCAPPCNPADCASACADPLYCAPPCEPTNCASPCADPLYCAPPCNPTDCASPCADPVFCGPPP
jgi:hypothetical protein